MQFLGTNDVPFFFLNTIGDSDPTVLKSVF